MREGTSDNFAKIHILQQMSLDSVKELEIFFVFVFVLFFCESD